MLALIAAHLLAITFYVFVKKKNLVRPMVTGDKVRPTPTPAARDDTATRLAALAMLALCASAVAWLVQLGG